MNFQQFYDEEIDLNKEIPPVVDSNEKKSEMDLDKNPTSSTSNTNLHHNNSFSRNEESFGSDSDLSKSDEIKNFSQKFNDIDKWQHLNVSKEIKECFLYVGKYTPQNIDIEYTLKPFIPDYVPAVGDVDAFLKITCPNTLDPKKQSQIDEMIKNLGLTVLDEPSGNQSEPSLLNVRLKSILTTNANIKTIQTPIAKSERDIHKWINEVEQLHISTQSKRPTTDIHQLANIDNLMVEWHTKFEQALNRIGFPFYNIDCDLHTYVRIVCALFDIPIHENTQYHYIIGLHTLFNLFLATNSSTE